MISSCPFFFCSDFFLSSKLFRHLCLPLPLSSPLFRSYVKWLRRPGCVGCRTEEALTTLPTSIHQEDSRLSSLSHLFSSACHSSALFIWGRRTASRPALPQYCSPSDDVDMMKWLLLLPSALFCCCISLGENSFGVLFSCKHREMWQCQWCLCLNHAA